MNPRHDRSPRTPFPIGIDGNTLWFADPSWLVSCVDGEIEMLKNSLSCPVVLVEQALIFIADDPQAVAAAVSLQIAPPTVSFPMTLR